MFFLLQSPSPISIPVQPTDYTQYGIAGAVVIVVAFFLWFLTKEREDRKSERDSFVQTIRERDKETDDALSKFTDVLRGCPARDRKE